MLKYVGAREARNNLAQLMGEVHYGGQTVIVNRSGRPMVAIIPIQEYQRLVSEREARFQILDEIRSRMPNIPMEEVEQDVAEAIAAVRTASLPLQKR
jgi:prevent-host-death family protein